MALADNLEVTTRSLGSTEVLAVAGQVDVATVDVLAGAIRDALDGRPETIVVDLSEAALFGPGGLGVLLAADAHARRDGCRLVVVPGTGAPRRLLDRTRGDQQLTIAT